MEVEPFDAKKICTQLRAALPTIYDYLVVTDGSGHQDGFGAYAGIYHSEKYQKFGSVYGSSTKTSVERMEFTALLETLHAVLLAQEKDETPKLRNVGRPLHVVWLCDRQSLVLQISGDYSRKTSTDLWERYAYYESIFKIYPIWVDRESKFSFHTFVDRTASEMRAMLKETDNIFKEYLVQAVTGYDKNFLTQMEKKKIGETNYSD